jgi:Kef-type K+ transport system membrane component KefB
VISQLAVLLLVGVSGAHLDLRRMRRRAGAVISISLGGLLVPFTCGVLAGTVLPAGLLGHGADRATFAIFLGVAMGVSALPVLAKTLLDLKLVHRDLGQLMLSAATIEDAIGWFLLSLVSAMATVGLRAGQVWLSAAYLAGAVLVVLLLGRRAARAAMRLASRAAGPEPVIATAAGLILLGGAASQALRLGPIFGAFVVGVLVGSPEVIDPARLAPLRAVVNSVLAPIFLAGVGLQIDLAALSSPAILLAGAAVLVIAVVGKFAGAYLGARLARLGHWEGVVLGAGLNARGVIEVVVATMGLQLGVLSPAAFTVIVLVAIITSVVAPPLLRWAMVRVESNADELLRASELAAWSQPGQVSGTEDISPR